MEYGLLGESLYQDNTKKLEYCRYNPNYTISKLKKF